MNIYKKFFAVVVLSFFLLGVPCFEFTRSEAAQLENINDDTEDELSAISFENVVETKFDQVPNAVHESVHDLYLKDGSDKSFAYSQIKGGEYDGHYIVSVTSDAKHFQGVHLESFVVTPDGNMKRVTSDKLISKINNLSHSESYSHKKLSSRAGKDNSYNGIRNRYNKALGNLANEIESIKLQNITPDQAKMFYKKRRELGEALKTESGFSKYLIYARNLAKYGDTLGPSYSSLAKKGLSPAEIAVKAVTSGGKDLGLKSSADNSVISKLNSQLKVLKEDNSYKAQRGAPSNTDSSIRKTEKTSVLGTTKTSKALIVESSKINSNEKPVLTSSIKVYNSSRAEGTKKITPHSSQNAGRPFLNSRNPISQNQNKVLNEKLKDY